MTSNSTAGEIKQASVFKISSIHLHLLPEFVTLTNIRHGGPPECPPIPAPGLKNVRAVHHMLAKSHLPPNYLPFGDVSSRWPGVTYYFTTCTLSFSQESLDTSTDEEKKQCGMMVK